MTYSGSIDVVSLIVCLLSSREWTSQMTSMALEALHDNVPPSSTIEAKASRMIIRRKLMKELKTDDKL